VFEVPAALNHTANLDALCGVYRAGNPRDGAGRVAEAVVRAERGVSHGREFTRLAVL